MIHNATISLTCDTEDCDVTYEMRLDENRKMPGQWYEDASRLDWLCTRYGWSIISRRELYCPACTKKRARAAKRAENKAAREKAT